jgi:hypothetical protein
MAEGVIRLVDLSFFIGFFLCLAVSQVLQFQTDTLATVSMCGNSSNSALLALIIDDST